MLNAVRSAGASSRILLVSPLPSHIVRRTSGVRFVQATSDPKQVDNMDKAQKQAKQGDVMSHSFGEGYATRSDEEGFGGIYSDKQTMSKSQGGKVVDENDPDESL